MVLNTIMHGRRKNFFQVGAKSGETCFLPLEMKKQPFFANNFKIQGGQGSLPPPSDAHAVMICSQHSKYRTSMLSAMVYIDARSRKMGLLSPCLSDN